MSSKARGGRYLETAHVNHSRPKADIGSKFPDLGPLLPQRDDCAPPLIVCGRCAVCQQAAARRLAALALAEHQFDWDGERQQDPAAAHADRADALRTGLLALGILAPEDKEPDTSTTEATAA